MKKRNAKKAAKGKAKRTGPSRRTAAERKAIDKRAATASRDAKRASRKANKIDKALLARCPSCHAQPGAPCFARDGRTVPTPHRLRMLALPAKKLQPLAAVLGPMVAATAGHKGKARSEKERFAAAAPVVLHASQGVPTIAIDKIKFGKRHRKDFSHVPALVDSINERGGLIQPISLRPDFTLIAGESRIKAWDNPRCKFKGQPIPYHILDVDSIIAGEWDENSKRKDFTPAEAVAIKRDVEKEFQRLRAERARADKAAPGRKASGAGAGRVADKAAKFAGKDRRTIEKAEKVVDAAARDPKEYGDLLDDMNRTGKVNAAAKKLKVREAKAAILAAPPGLPMKLNECGTVVIDFPHAGEPDADQDKLDAAGRAFRPYPEMAIKSCCAFARDEIAPQLADTVSVWLLVTNFILVRGYHLHLIAALGFKPENAATMLTWGKDKIGRGKILRDQTEHAILLTRGNPLIDVFGENPPSTLLLAPRRENSRKPDEFWRLVERVTPAKRYASIFSQGGEGENWDGHGDQVGKFAPAIARAAEAEVLAEAKAAPAAVDPARNGLLLTILETLGREPGTKLEPDWLASGGLLDGLVSGKRKRRLTVDGRMKLQALREQRGQIDLEEAIAAKPAPAALDPAAIDAFENADLYRVSADVIDAAAKIGGHTFARTIDWDQGEKGHSIATCQCGVTFRADRTLPYSGENVIAPQEEAHWREVIALAGKSALFAAEQPAEPGAVETPIAASAEGDDLEIPAFLRVAQPDDKVRA